MKKVIPDLIVSLTSYPLRINTVHKTLKTLYEQTITPGKIVLCLAKDEFKNLEKDLPNTILEFTNKGLEILWCENIGSYKKLIPTLRKYPDKIIVTVDDDIYYDQNLLKILYDSYLKPKLS